MHLDEYEVLVRTGFLLHVEDIEFFYFDSFGVEHVPEQTEKFIGQKKNIKTNILQIYTNNLIMCAYFCIEFIDFMFLCLQVKL